MDDATVKMGAEVAALEMVLKTVITFQLAATVKDEAGFVKAAELGRQLQARLDGYISDMMEKAKALPSYDAATMAVMERAMRETVARCYDQPSAMMSQVADIVLELSESPSDAKN